MQAYAQQGNPRFKVKSVTTSAGDSLWGYYDTQQHRFVLKPVYARIRLWGTSAEGTLVAATFPDEMMPEWLQFDKQGRLIRQLKPKHEVSWYDDLSPGFFLASDAATGKWGVISVRDNQTCVPFENTHTYTIEVYNEHNGCISPVMNQGWALSNGKRLQPWLYGNRQLKHHYELVYPSVEGGLLAVQIDSTCTVVGFAYKTLPCGVKVPSHSLGLVKLQNNRGQYGLQHATGELLIPCMYDTLEEKVYKHGRLIIVRKEGRVGATLLLNNHVRYQKHALYDSVVVPKEGSINANEVLFWKGGQCIARWASWPCSSMMHFWATTDSVSLNGTSVRSVLNFDNQYLHAVETESGWQVVENHKHRKSSFYEGVRFSGTQESPRVAVKLQGKWTMYIREIHEERCSGNLISLGVIIMPGSYPQMKESPYWKQTQEPFFKFDNVYEVDGVRAFKRNGKYGYTTAYAYRKPNLDSLQLGLNGEVIIVKQKRQGVWVCKTRYINESQNRLVRKRSHQRHSGFWNNLKLTGWGILHPIKYVKFLKRKHEFAKKIKENNRKK